MSTITFYADDIELEIPAKYELCQRCRGKGTHVNPAIDGNGLSQEDMDEAGPEFFDDYMAGVYDVACYACKGRTTVLVADTMRMSADQVTAWMNHLEEEASDRRMIEMEIRTGA